MLTVVVNMCELVLLQRMDSGEPSSSRGRRPTLLEGVRACEGIPRESWNTRVVILTNEAGEDVARAICQSVDASVVVDTNGRPIGDDHVAVQIAETLKEEEVPSGWMWSMHSWPIKRVFLNGASLHDHDQTDMYRKAVNAQNQRPRKGIRSYKTTHARRNVDIPGKKERVLNIEAIHEVSTKSCCERNCVQPFPRSEIEAIRSELHVKGGVYNRKSVLLEVHRQVHKDSNGKEWITLKGREVYPSAWQTIHAISRATYYRYKEMATLGKQAEGHGNLGSKKPRMHTMQATATLRVMIGDDTDRMPNKTRTLNSGEREFRQWYCHQRFDGKTNYRR